MNKASKTLTFIRPVKGSLKVEAGVRCKGGCDMGMQTRSQRGYDSSEKVFYQAF